MLLSKLAPSARVEGRWILHLEDGTQLKVTDREMVDFSLYQGMELPEAAVDQLRQAAGESSARRRATNILSARPLSRQELERRLTQKGEEPETAAAAADRMEELGYLNDEAYAVTLAQHYSRKGYGPRKVQEELRRRGVSREHWDEALDTMGDQEDTIDKLVHAKLRGEVAPDRATLKKVSDGLARRGFSWDEISQALRRYQSHLEDEAF